MRAAAKRISSSASTVTAPRRRSPSPTSCICRASSIWRAAERGAFLVNFRHVFYALSFPLHRVRGRWGKGYATFALTDEAYALTTGAAAREWSGRRILWLQVLCQGYWVAGATVGAGGAALLPVRLDGLDFALTALFVVLAVDGYRAERDIPVPVVALGCALAARLLLPGQMLPVALGLFTAALSIRRFATSSELTRA
ncbi:AzlC family ABC transporter permease [Nocardia sp. NPDC004568]|uniref:AzlC family ABC transporter permease n=1 Tax=Nocardia sp. NPDC004568 TaxID=3154551 RepID=UPI0033B5B22B